MRLCVGKRGSRANDADRDQGACRGINGDWDRTHHSWSLDCRYVRSEW